MSAVAPGGSEAQVPATEGNSRDAQRWHMCSKYILELYLLSCFSSPKITELLGLHLGLFHLPMLLK
jgi:hypothetical protein